MSLKRGKRIFSFSQINGLETERVFQVAVFLDHISIPNFKSHSQGIMMFLDFLKRLAHRILLQTLL